MNQKHSFNAIDNMLLTLWSIGAFVAISLVVVIFKIGLHNIKDIAPLIGAFAILISAGIASMSVMKSIYTTQQNEKLKAEKEKERKRIFALNVMKTIQVTLTTFSKKAESQYRSSIGLRSFRTVSDFDSDIQTTGKLLNSVFCESILPYLTEEEQIIVSNFYSEYYRFLATNEDDITKQSHMLSPGHLSTKKPQKPLHQYIKMFSDLAQSYIDLNTQKEKEQNA